MEIKLKILAVNILKLNYQDNEHCPITEALRMAGLAMMDFGTVIRNKNSYTYFYPTGHKEIKEKLFAMYNSKESIYFIRKGNVRVYLDPIPIEDFEATITFTEEEAKNIQYL